MEIDVFSFGCGFLASIVLPLVDILAVYVKGKYGRTNAQHSTTNSAEQD